jgi:hypothetical protein
MQEGMMAPVPIRYSNLLHKEVDEFRTCVRTFSPSTMTVSSHLLESRLFYTQTKTGTDDKNAAFVTQQQQDQATTCTPFT